MLYTVISIICLEFVFLNDIFFHILFNAPDKVNVKDGVSSTTYTYAPSALEIFKNNAENTTFDFEVLETQILQFITNRLVDLDAVQ